jgi:hypothetical protein
MRIHFTVLVALLGGTAFTHAQSNWGTSATVTIALTVTYSNHGTVAKDETGRPLTGESAAPAFSNEFQVATQNRDGDTTRTVATKEYLSRPKSFRWGNAQIISSLVAAEAIPQKGREPYISGWSIIRVSASDGAVSYYARHTDKTSVALQDIGLDLVSSDAEGMLEAATVTEKSMTTTVFDLTGEGLDAVTESYSFVKSFVGMGVGNALLAINLSGVLTGGSRNVVQRERIVDPDLGAQTFSTNVRVNGPWRLTGCVGSTPISLFDETAVPGIIQGTISTAPAVIQNLDTFFPPPPEPLF